MAILNPLREFTCIWSSKNFSKYLLVVLVNFERQFSFLSFALMVTFRFSEDEMQMEVPGFRRNLRKEVTRLQEPNCSFRVRALEQRFQLKRGILMVKQRMRSCKNAVTKANYEVPPTEFCFALPKSRQMVMGRIMKWRNSVLRSWNPGAVFYFFMQNGSFLCRNFVHKMLSTVSDVKINTKMCWKWLIRNISPQKKMPIWRKVAFSGCQH